ncbi:sensor domain-containing diguanylate cyclase [Ectothiorhodospiraceae bacterium WFHF3C12]|nr:sensor domain-containing diguanylate cyclase [Ectothiorhodospiraceae bacterium WFHF3C12]
MLDITPLSSERDPAFAGLARPPAGHRGVWNVTVVTTAPGRVEQTSSCALHQGAVLRSLLVTAGTRGAHLHKHSNERGSPISPSKAESDDAVYKTLLESTKAIPWKIDWATLRFAYIGPQIEHLLGWAPESWQTIDDWAERMHPDDRDRVVEYCVSQSRSGADHEADYRALTRDGTYVWIRDVVHVVRDDDGEVNALIGFMLDISERKRNEEEVARLQKKLEELSFQDGLTGVANRRMVDSFLAAEWAKALVTQEPLAVILADIDYFKQYNDRYGHLQGDECLKRVAQALRGAIGRTRDLVGRFGGEEFVLVLPNTGEAAAHAIAERCRALVAELEIPHDGAKAGSFLTVSAGTGAEVPDRAHTLTDFLNRVDARLYEAKRRGRDCVVSGS